ncbi:hypothetical protein ASE86_10380 [Sphingomonas sp. Leaf33]|uniref:hypothetical protein n=1 Tax=Sphingomonas sp. Leaf33 TaxID=1736215 RepID=UPI0006FFB14A|nr:hypothetical protein [Sphingomonas sp. Leaf33]KQN26500.1 hypothetical protein ASE86_10380 [Sphingomonas sp. Leaf33]
MILVLAALALIQTADPPVDDVVVTARKLANLDIVLKRRRGRLVCRYKRSSGDAALDTAACSVSIACHEKAASVADLKACITSGLTALLAPRTDPT